MKWRDIPRGHGQRLDLIFTIGKLKKRVWHLSWLLCVSHPMCQVTEIMAATSSPQRVSLSLRKKERRSFFSTRCDLELAIGLSFKICLFFCFNAGKMIAVIYSQDQCKNIMNSHKDQYEKLLFKMIHDIDDY